VWVTGYTDASFQRKTGGAWAVWLRSDEGRIVRSGTCPPYVRDSQAAELAAIYASVYLATKTWPATRGVLICSDCQGALAAAEVTAALASDRAIRRLQQRLRDVIAAARVDLRLRWVKGHRPKSADTRAWLNHQVDRLAGKARRAALDADDPRARRTKSRS
jgi:ribonuclease HI